MVPIPVGRYSTHDTCKRKELMNHREKALAKRHSLGHERWSEHVRSLPALKVGDFVYVQNQVGNNPGRWETTGKIVELLQNDQYRVRIDGSGRVNLRNRKFLRQFTPFHPSPYPPPHPNPPDDSAIAATCRVACC